ncbi:MAG: I78 family peptidase inhibitor [Sphingopyxis sp.]
MPIQIPGQMPASRAIRRRAAALVMAAGFAATLTGCAGGDRARYETGVREPISLREDGDECGASLVQSFIGLRANTTLRQEIGSRSGAANLRWVEPGMAVTMDYRGDRLTAELDQDGVVTTLRCG